MIEAIGKIPASEEVEFRLAGSLPPRLAEVCAALPGMRRTSYLGWLDKRGLAEDLGQARAGLVLLHPTNNYRVIRPNKLYEYMAAGLPVIASDFPHWRELVGGCRCGLLVDPLDSTAIADAILHLLSHPQAAAEMGQRGRGAVLERYNWGTERARLIVAYEELLAGQREAAESAAA
jgi:glycosyltransferase involved in cell wall biosynthesis